MNKSKFTSVLTVCLSIVILGTGCLPSSRDSFDHYTDSGGTIRCATSQVAIGEYADRDSSGRYPALAITSPYKDLFCVNDDPATAPGWGRLEATSRLVYYVNSQQVATCRVGPTVTATGSDSSAFSVVYYRCGSNRKYYAYGYHESRRWGTTNVQVDFRYSPEIVLP